MAEAFSLGTRIKSKVFVKPVVFGNVARYFAKKREDDGRTHEWTAFFRSYTNEDLSVYVKRIHFKLHDSYPNNTRILAKPPYEVQETGWGEFELVIRVYFHDPSEKPVTFLHMIRLFSTDPEIIAGRKLLVNEVYDELVFNEPTQSMYQLLTQEKPLGPETPFVPHQTDCAPFIPRNLEALHQQTLEQMVTARERVRAETRQLQTRVREARLLIERYREEIKRLDTAGGGSGGTANGGVGAAAVTAALASSSGAGAAAGAGADMAAR